MGFVDCCVLGSTLSEQFCSSFGLLFGIDVFNLPWELCHILRAVNLAAHEFADDPSEPSCYFPCRSVASSDAIQQVLHFPVLHLIQEVFRADSALAYDDFVAIEGG